MTFRWSKTLLLMLLSSSTLLSVVEAVANVNIMDLLPLIPSCALPCVIQGVATNPGALANPSSTCRNVTLQASISQCLQTSCNYTEQSKVAVVNMQLCAGVPIEDSRKWTLFIVSIVFGPLSLATIALRTYSRYKITKKMDRDDWTIIAAGAVMVGVLVANYLNIFRNGFGRHYWNIDPLRVTELLQIFYAAEIFYIILITLVKVSILQFYLRVFPTRWFRLANLATLILVIAACIGILLPIIVQCNPIAGAWDRSITNAKCININLLAYATGGIGVGLDIIILALPIPELLKLKMSRRNKAHVLFMFSLGSIACITSIIRLKYLADFARSTDQTWDNIMPVIWSLIEVSIAIICACLPSLRALLAYHLPRFFSSETSTNGRYYNHQLSNISATHNSAFRGRAVVSKLSSQSGGSTILVTSTIGKEEKGIPLEPITSPKPSWLPKSPLAHDIERQSQEGDSFAQGLKLNHTPSTVTTKIWVDNTANNPDHAFKLTRANSVSVDKHTHQTQHFAPQSLPTTSEDPRAGSKPQVSRNGSEDSIFALEGPRESDSDTEDERQGELGLKKFDFQTGRPLVEFGGGLDVMGMRSSLPTPPLKVAALRTSGSANGGSAIESTTVGENSRPRAGRSASSPTAPTLVSKMVEDRGRGVHRGSITGVAVAVRVEREPNSSAGITKPRSNSALVRPGSAAALAGSGAVSNEAGVRPVESRPNTSVKRTPSANRGNRYNSQGILRRNSSLDLRNGEVKIPISMFSAGK